MNEDETVFTLASWAIKQDGEKFFIAKSWTKKHEWSKSYKSLTQACNAIARHLEREWTERQQRRETFDRRIAKRRAA